MWLALPLSIGAPDSNDWPACALYGWTSLTCLVSTLFWPLLGTPAGRVLYALDKLCAHLQFLFLLLYFALERSPLQHSWHYVTTFPVVIILCFGLSRVFEVVIPHDLLASIAHLSFRFAGYWWTFLAIAACETSLKYVVLNSMVYWVHIVITLARCGRREKFCCRDALEYTRGAAEVVCLVGVVLIAMSTEMCV